MDTSDPTIGIALPYFGPFPEYAPLFFWTCGFNKSVDFYLFTDQNYEEYLPDNVHVVTMSMEEFHSLAQEKLGMIISLKFGYKLCDLKPMYGVILSDWLEGYDFWGFCDMDVLWGDIRAFASAEWLAGTDLAAFRGKGYLSGALQLYRNVPHVNNLYQMSPNVDRVLAEERVQNFTEAGYKWGAPPRTVAEIASAGDIVSMTDIAREANQHGAIRLNTPKWATEPSIRFHNYKYLKVDFKWDHGTLTRVSDSCNMIYMHMVYLKREKIFSFNLKKRKPKTFYIRPFGIEYIDSSNITLRILSLMYGVTKNAGYISQRMLNRIAN